MRRLGQVHEIREVIELTEGSWGELDRDVDDLARAYGCEVIRPDASTLLLDLDDKESEDQFRNYRERLIDDGIILDEHERWASKSNHVHVRQPLTRPLSVEARLFLQLLLGSDPVRELLSFLRVQAGIDDPIVLFKPLPGPKTELVDDWDDLPF